MPSAMLPAMEIDHVTVRVRPAREEDRDAVMALASRLAEGVAPWREPQAAVHAARQWLTASLAEAPNERRAVFVAVETRDGRIAGAEDHDGRIAAKDRGGRVVGVVSVGRQQHFTGDTDAYVGELAVAPDAVRGGIGRRLMAAAEDWARRQGLRHLTLETAAANTTARQFYAALGFLEEGIRLTRPLE